jgi:transposase
MTRDHGYQAPSRRRRRRRQLSEAHYIELDLKLTEGPREHGFDADAWTAQMAAELIFRISGLRYEPKHVWRFLGPIGWWPLEVANQTYLRPNLLPPRRKA